MRGRNSSWLLRGLLRGAPRASLGLAGVLARKEWLVNASRRDRLRAAFRQVFPEWDVETLDDHARQHLVATYQNGLGTLWARHLKAGDLESLTGSCRLQIPDPSPFLQPGPVLIMAPHYGNLFMGGLAVAAAAAAGRKKLAILLDDPAKNPRNAILVEAYGRLDPPPALLYNQPRHLVKFLGILKQGGVGIILPDVYDTSSNLVFVPFLGHLSMAMQGTAVLAIQAKAAIHPAYCYLDENQEWVLHINRPIPAHRYQKTEQDIFRLTCACFRSMERQIRKFPEPWMYWEAFPHRHVGHLDPAPFQWAQVAAILARQSVDFPMLKELCRDLPNVM